MEVTLDEQGIDDSDLLKVPEETRVLNAAGNNLTRRGARIIADRFRQLESLNLDRNSIGDVGASNLLKIETLREVSLRDNGISDVGAKLLAGRYDFLDLRGNDIGSRGGEVQRAALACGAARRGGVEILDLEGQGITDAEAKEIAKHLPNYTLLRRLRLAHNNIGDAGRKALETAAHKCPFLEDIDLRYNLPDRDRRHPFSAYV